MRLPHFYSKTICFPILERLNMMKDIKILGTKIARIKNTSISLRRRLLFLVVVSWIVPVCIIFIFITMSYYNSIIEKTEMLMEEGLKNFTSFHSQKIDEAISISKKTSYELTIEKAWREYNDGNMNDVEFHKEVTGNLRSVYYNDKRFVMSVLYLKDNPEQIYYTSRKQKSYDNYIENVQDKAFEITNLDSSDAHIRVIGGKVYIIRNLYTTRNYIKFGTLVVELDKKRLFEGNLLNKDYKLGYYINDTESFIAYDSTLEDDSSTFILHKIKQQYSSNTNRKIVKLEDSNFTGLLYQQKFDDYHFGAVLIADKSIIYSELKHLIHIMILILLVIIPVFIYMLYFISKHITTPMGRMIKATKEIEKGKIGTEIKGASMPNAEFSSLMDSFNRMSSEVKYLFDYAYNEKLARKEAKIIALQSQINPHFLNNTLEMMNWQARMAGDMEVSKMIEALGTLLDYSMDRTNRKLISLAEELRCGDAYLYIVSMRFGQRLRVEKEVDPELLQIQVPQLILQPILENAITHGVEKVKNGRVKVKMYREENMVILQVINTGKGMTKEDIIRVKKILAGNREGITGKGKHVSLGIHNVNERIKLIYGEEYGLTIEAVDIEGTEGTASTITIPYEVKDYAINEIQQECTNNVKLN